MFVSHLNLTVSSLNVCTYLRFAPPRLQESADQLSAEFSLEHDGLELVENAPQNDIVCLE